MPHAGTLFDTRELAAAVEEIYRYPLRPTAVDTLNRQLRAGISDEQLASSSSTCAMKAAWYRSSEEDEEQEPQIICSLGCYQRGVACPSDADRVRQHLAEFDLVPLFVEELGWDRYNGRLPVSVDGHEFVLAGVAEKRGMVAFEALARQRRLPDYAHVEELIVR